MFYFLSDNKCPLQYVSSGKLVSEPGFKHTYRDLDTYVLLAGIDGVLPITQDDRHYELKSGEILLLFPGHIHFGTYPCTTNISYYWCHFKPSSDSFQLLSEDGLKDYIVNTESNKIINRAFCDCYLLPEYTSVLSYERISVFFREILDISRRTTCSHRLLDYALSLLCLELSYDYLSQRESETLSEGTKTRCNITEIIEWIRINHNNELNISKISNHFGYSPNYLSSIFKKQTGMPLIQYINSCKIGDAKKLLLNSFYSVKEISAKTGFSDEKYLMKLFKKMEDMTPSQYRKAFSLIKVNKN